VKDFEELQDMLIGFQFLMNALGESEKVSYYENKRDQARFILEKDLSNDKVQAMCDIQNYSADLGKARFCKEITDLCKLVFKKSEESDEDYTDEDFGLAMEKLMEIAKSFIK